MQKIGTFKKVLMNRIIENRFANPHLAGELCEALREESKRTNDMYGLMYAYMYKGDVEFTLGNLEKALDNLEIAVNIGNEGEYDDLLMLAYNLLAIIYEIKLDEMLAINYYYKSLKLAIKYENYYVQRMIYSNISSMYLEYKNVKKALKYFMKSQEVRKFVNDEDYDIGVEIKERGNAARIYYLLKDYEKALSYLDEEFIDEEAMRINKCMIFIGSIKASIYFKLGNVDKVIEICERTLQCDEVEFEQIEYFDDLIDFVKVCIKVGESAKALFFLKKIYKMCEKESASKRWFEYYEQYMKYANLVKDEAILFDSYEKYYEYRNSYLEEMKAFNIASIDNRIELINKKKKKYIIEKESRQLEMASKQDELTKLPNRYALNEYMNKSIEKAVESRDSISVLIMDIDHFKEYNDEFGHLEGDKCIKKIANIIDSTVENQGISIRYGGDEFVVVLYNCSKEDTLKVGNTILENVRLKELPFKGNNKNNIVSITIGATIIVPDAKTKKEDIIKVADAALYEAKRAGRDRIVFGE